MLPDIQQLAMPSISRVPDGQLLSCLFRVVVLWGGGACQLCMSKASLKQLLPVQHAYCRHAQFTGYQRIRAVTTAALPNRSYFHWQACLQAQQRSSAAHEVLHCYAFAERTKLALAVKTQTWQEFITQKSLLQHMSGSSWCV